MERRVRIRTIGALAGVFCAASAVLNAIFALTITNVPALAVLRILVFIAFAISVLDLACIAYFSTCYVSGLNGRLLGEKARIWGFFLGSLLFATASLCVSGVSLVWLAVRRASLRTEVFHTASTTLLWVWFGLWAVSGGLQVAFFCLLGVWTKSVLKTQRASRLDLDFGIRVPSMSVARRPSTQHTERTFGSQDATLNSPPRTPVSRSESAIRRSSSTQVGPGSSRTKLIRHSNRSSFETMALPAADGMLVDSVFDSRDPPSGHHEMRALTYSSSPATRTGLATIPGSRPGSPADALNGPFLPEPPTSSSPHAATSDTATAVGWSSSPRQPTSSPPSSPPNFSRPTSSSQNKPAPPKFEPFDTSMQGLIHPLFRSNSPRPPPLATLGTTVTASPLADHPITPRTLASLRKHSAPLEPAIHLRATPSIDSYETESVDNTPPDSPTPDSPTLGSSPLGSPGPSIVDDTELPPILPGFVLSAGSRSSLVGYDKRKSLKNERPRSQLSMGDMMA